MCVYVYVCVYVYNIYVYTYIYTYIHIYIHAYIHAYIHTYRGSAASDVCVCVYMYIIYTYNIYIYTYIHGYTHAYIHAYTPVRARLLRRSASRRLALARRPGPLRPPGPSWPSFARSSCPTRAPPARRAARLGRQPGSPQFCLLDFAEPDVLGRCSTRTHPRPWRQRAAAADLPRCDSSHPRVPGRVAAGAQRGARMQARQRTKATTTNSTSGNPEPQRARLRARSRTGGVTPSTARLSLPPAACFPNIPVCCNVRLLELLTSKGPKFPWTSDILTCSNKRTSNLETRNP